MSSMMKSLGKQVKFVPFAGRSSLPFAKRQRLQDTHDVPVRKLQRTEGFQVFSVTSPAGVQNQGTPVQATKAGKVIVIGAGPAGSMAALSLARQGFNVDVYERRPEPKQDEIDIRRSYIIALSMRGISALKEKGIQIQDQAKARYLGTVTKRFKGKRRVSPAEPGSVCFDRFELAQFLINEVHRLVPGKVHYHFQSSLENIDLENRRITVGHPQGSNDMVQYDLLIAADGVNSAVRTRLEESSKSFTEFEKLDTVQEYEKLIRSSVRGLPKDWPPQIARQCAYAPANSNGKRVRCSSLHGPSMILLGDAAHAVTPIGGQGCNAALEDGVVLERVLAEAEGPFGVDGDLRKVPEAWTEARWKDARALVNIESSFYKLVGGRKLGVLDPAFLRLIAHIVVGSLLHKLMPWWFQRPALARLGSPLPYSEIERRVNRDAVLVLLATVTCAVLAALKALHVF